MESSRLAHNAPSVTHPDAFRQATEGSAKRLGRKDIGEIAAGYQADIACFTLKELRFSGARDPVTALLLVWRASGRRDDDCRRMRVTDSVTRRREPFSATSNQYASAVSETGHSYTIAQYSRFSARSLINKLDLGQKLS